MHRQYSPEDRAIALDLLHEKGGNVPYVSYLTGISERTLYSWRKQLKYAQAEQEAPQPEHWIRQHPERQERLQQQHEKRLQQQQQRHQMTAFGITQEELDEAMKVEFVPSPYTNLHADLLLHLQHLNFSLTDDPDTAHRKALAFSRILEDALKLEEMTRIQKPQLTLFKYEYPDKSYHDIPFWSNAVHERAQRAYEAVVAEARRQYEEQQAASNAPAPTPVGTSNDTSENDSPENDTFSNGAADDSVPTPVGTSNGTSENDTSSNDSPLSVREELLYEASLTVDDLLAMPFQPEDFIPKHTGIHKYLFGEDPYAQYKDSEPDDSP